MDIPCSLEDDLLGPILSGHGFQVNASQPGEIRLAINHRGKLRDLCCFAGVEFKALDPPPVERQAGPVDVLDANDVGPLDCKRGLCRHRLNGCLGRWGFRGYAVVRLMGQEGEGHPENIDVLGFEHAGFPMDLVGGTAETPSNHLLAQQLAGKRPGGP